VKSRLFSNSSDRTSPLQQQEMRGPHSFLLRPPWLGNDPLKVAYQPPTIQFLYINISEGNAPSPSKWDLYRASSL
jgi:hypothetical protein